jgi:hypothetical protein
MPRMIHRPTTTAARPAACIVAYTRTEQDRKRTHYTRRPDRRNTSQLYMFRRTHAPPGPRAVYMSDTCMEVFFPGPSISISP